MKPLQKRLKSMATISAILVDLFLLGLTYQWGIITLIFAFFVVLITLPTLVVLLDIRWTKAIFNDVPGIEKMLIWQERYTGILYTLAIIILVSIVMQTPHTYVLAKLILVLIGLTSFMPIAFFFIYIPYLEHTSKRIL